MMHFMVIEVKKGNFSQQLNFWLKMGWFGLSFPYLKNKNN